MRARKRGFYRLFAGSDTHCGHRAGLTPPGYQDSAAGLFPMFAKLQRETWGWFASEVAALQPFDGAAWVGDMIDGRGERSGGTELVTTDRNKQIDMAEAVVRTVGAASNRFVRGTPYHTGDEENFEDNLAARFDAKISDQAWIRKHGLTFHLKHHLGGTSTPYGKGTPLMKDMLWGQIWSELEEQPKADFILRGHTHRYLGVDDVGPGNRPRMGFCLPALQAAATKYGGTKLSSVVHFGFMVFDIYPDGEVRWQKRILFVQAARPQVEDL